jgi:signal transduction histidine kinase
MTFKDMAERLALERMKSEFVALASHELRTPLTSVLGYLQLVLDGEAGPLSEEQERLLRVVERSAVRLERLVGDVLLVAQADAGRLRLHRQPVDLGAVVRQSVEGARPSAEAAGVALELWQEPLPPILADRDRLAQVLDNLVSNALKFTPREGRVTVRCAAQGGRVEVEVADTGIGIPQEEQDQLFERFYRSSVATRQAIPGTGLGLAIVKTIVEAHDGAVRLESHEGRGTTVVVSLPLVPAPAARELAPAGAGGSDGA